MTECSIGDGDGDSLHNVIEDVMVCHLTNGVRTSISAVTYGENHLPAVEFACRFCLELRSVYGMKHPFEVVQPRHHSGTNDRDHESNETNFAPGLQSMPENDCEDQGGNREDRGNPRSALPHSH